MSARNDAVKLHVEEKNETQAYLEVAKRCPKCYKKTLFFCCIVVKIKEHEFQGKLGVKCRSCGYKKELEEVKE